MPISFSPGKVSVPLVMCYGVKQHATSSRATSFFISLTLANIFLPLLRCGRELIRVIQAPFGPVSMDEHGLHELIGNRSEVELMTCSFKVLFISLSPLLCPHTLSEQVYKQPWGSGRPDFKAVRNVLWVNKSNPLTSELKSLPIHRVGCT